jgi:hypothetical protein
MGMKQLLISLSPFASPLSLLAVNEALPLSALQHQREAEKLSSDTFAFGLRCSVALADGHFIFHYAKGHSAQPSQTCSGGFISAKFLLFADDSLKLGSKKLV